MRVHVFQGADYYPQAGVNDYTASFDTTEEAIAYAIANPSEDWYSVVVDDGERLTEHQFGHYER